MFFQVPEPINIVDYLNYFKDNSGIAAPTPLFKHNLEKQLDQSMIALADNIMTLYRGTFKEGHLQISTPFDKPNK